MRFVGEGECEAQSELLLCVWEDSAMSWALEALERWEDIERGVTSDAGTSTQPASTEPSLAMEGAHWLTSDGTWAGQHSASASLPAGDILQSPLGALATEPLTAPSSAAPGGEELRGSSALAAKGGDSSSQSSWASSEGRQTDGCAESLADTLDWEHCTGFGHGADESRREELWEDIDSTLGLGASSSQPPSAALPPMGAKHAVYDVEAVARAHKRYNGAIDKASGEPQIVCTVGYPPRPDAIALFPHPKPLLPPLSLLEAPGSVSVSVDAGLGSHHVWRSHGIRRCVVNPDQVAWFKLRLDDFYYPICHFKDETLAQTHCPACDFVTHRRAPLIARRQRVAVPKRSPRREWYPIFHLRLHFVRYHTSTFACVKPGCGLVFGSFPEGRRHMLLRHKS